jgi:hypothetical protein
MGNRIEKLRCDEIYLQDIGENGGEKIMENEFFREIQNIDEFFKDAEKHTPQPPL